MLLCSCVPVLVCAKLEGSQKRASVRGGTQTQRQTRSQTQTQTQTPNTNTNTDSDSQHSVHRVHRCLHSFHSLNSLHNLRLPIPTVLHLISPKRPHGKVPKRGAPIRIISSYPPILLSSYSHILTPSHPDILYSSTPGMKWRITRAGNIHSRHSLD